MTDIIERVEAVLAADREQCGWRAFVVDLVAALKVERAENELLRSQLHNIRNYRKEGCA